jgi:hypothetical protein
MTTPAERTKAVLDTREFLGLLATAPEVEIPGLVQSVAVCLLRHYPVDVDINASASVLPSVWARTQTHLKPDGLHISKDMLVASSSENQLRNAPTLFVDYDGTLHSGRTSLGADGVATLDSGRPLFEYAPLLVELLRPYPSVEIVLTTSWLESMTKEKVISFLPTELSRRVVDTTRGRKARLSYVLSGAGRTDIITDYAVGNGLQHWLAIDDSVYGAYHFGREPGELVRNFVLLDSNRGISDEAAQLRIREWLVETHKDGGL